MIKPVAGKKKLAFIAGRDGENYPASGDLPAAELLPSGGCLQFLPAKSIQLLVINFTFIFNYQAAITNNYQRMKDFILFFFFVLTSSIIQGQASKFTLSLKDTTDLEAINVAIQPGVLKGKRSVKVFDAMPGKDPELKIVKLPDSLFHNGIIEVQLSGEPMKNSSEGARGFVGIAFRVDKSNSKFECIYLRPTNGRADDQVRRNHSVQYISYPGFPWEKLRKEFPKKYETYVDLEPGAWTKIKIEVKGNTAKLFVHTATQPTLIVSDLKHGENLRGSIGLWIGPGTEAHFRNISITKYD